MNNKRIYIFLILFLLGINIFLLYSYKQLKNRKSNPEVLLTKNENDEPNNVLLTELTGIQYESNGTLIDGNAQLITSLEEVVSIKDIINHSPKLVFNFKNISCKTCFEDEMDRLISLSDKIGKDNIIFISKFTNIREQYVLEKKYDITILNMDNDSLGLPIEKKYYPFIFIIDKNLVAKDFYIPTTEFYFLGDNYYDIIFNKYFK